MIASAAIPALVALLLKLMLFAYAIKSVPKNTATSLLLALLVIVVLQNFVEVVGLTYFHGQVTPFMTWIGFLYLAMTIAASALILHLSMQLGLDRTSNRQLLLYAPAAALLVLLFTTDYLVLGFQPFRNTLLRVPGPGYFFFESYLVLYLLAAAGFLAYGARPSREWALARARTRLWLFALVPMGLLLTYLVIANHYGVAKLTSTIYMPLAITFFLTVATYAIHKYRLFDVAYLLPWSGVRKQKTALYRHIQALAADTAEQRPIPQILESLAGALRCPVALIGEPQALARPGPEGPVSAAEQPLREFPLTALRNVDRLVVAHEVADTAPELHALMQRYRVGAIAPFKSSRWILFGEGFSDSVYMPLDFQVVETLLDKIAGRFNDNLHWLRAKLDSIQQEARESKQRLAIAWDELGKLREQAMLLEEQNYELREETAMLRRQSESEAGKLPKIVALGDKTLEQHMIDAEKALLVAALRHAHGNKVKAARLLGLWPESGIDHLLARHGLCSDDYTR